MNETKKRLLIPFTIIFCLVISCVVYVNDYYPADQTVSPLMMNSDTVKVRTLDNQDIVFEPQNTKAGFIFYPGGKVEYTAYVPLLHQLAKQGVLCILVKMPFNLAVLDSNAASGLQSLYPDIDSWYIGGHSLGGSMAASYVSKHPDQYDGLILLASYSTADLSETPLHVLSIYGSNDQVLNLQKYEENKVNLPIDFTESIIDGGIHAYFGSYGHQKGDGTPTLSNDEQIAMTTDLLTNYMIQDPK